MQGRVKANEGVVSRLCLFVRLFVRLFFLEDVPRVRLVVLILVLLLVVMVLNHGSSCCVVVCGISVGVGGARVVVLVEVLVFPR